MTRPFLPVDVDHRHVVIVFVQPSLMCRIIDIDDFQVKANAGSNNLDDQESRFAEMAVSTRKQRHPFQITLR